MPKYNYWCINCDCGASMKERDFLVDKPEEKREEEELCPRNRTAMKLMGEKMIGTASRTMNKEEMVQSLKKRSKDHFKKHIKEQKDDMIKKSAGG